MWKRETETYTEGCFTRSWYSSFLLGSLRTRLAALSQFSVCFRIRLQNFQNANVDGMNWFIQRYTCKTLLTHAFVIKHGRWHPSACIKYYVLIYESTQSTVCRYHKGISEKVKNQIFNGPIPGVLSDKNETFEGFWKKRKIKGCWFSLKVPHWKMHVKCIIFCCLKMFPEFKICWTS